MGMSLTIAGALGGVAYAWINTKASPFGRMIARCEFVELDNLFFRTLLQSSALLLSGEIAILSLLFVIARCLPHLAERMLPIPVFAVLLSAIFLNHILYSEALYLRAHKREPFIVLSTLIATLTCASTLLTGRFWGATGVTIGYFFCGGLLYLGGGTLIFVKFRSRWHAPRDCDAAVRT
jgi:hypothetical protein